VPISEKWGRLEDENRQGYRTPQKQDIAFKTKQEKEMASEKTAPSS